ESLLSSASLYQAWGKITAWHSPSSAAEVALMKEQLETVKNFDGDDPKLFFVRVDKFRNALAHAGVTKTEQEIVEILLRNLSNDYHIEK
ncbi:unnamed protein product, partial [Hapterophycus canaliculatus]